MRYVMVLVCLLALGTTLLLPWQRSSSAEPERVAPRSRWEYKVLTGYQVGEIGLWGTRPTVDSILTDEAVQKGLCKLGEEGWELVAIVREPQNRQLDRKNNDRTFYFKRLR